MSDMSKRAYARQVFEYLGWVLAAAGCLFLILSYALLGKEMWYEVGHLMVVALLLIPAGSSLARHQRRQRFKERGQEGSAPKPPAPKG